MNHYSVVVSILACPFSGFEDKHVANIITGANGIGVINCQDEVLIEPEYDEIIYDLKVTAARSGKKVEALVPISKYDKEISLSAHENDHPGKWGASEYQKSRADVLPPFALDNGSNTGELPPLPWDDGSDTDELPPLPWEDKPAGVILPPVPYSEIADLYNSICTSFPRLNNLSDARKRAIKARFSQYGIEDFRRLFETAENSAFLKGKNDRNWTATFDWLIKDANMAKVLDGNYSDGVQPSGLQHGADGTAHPDGGIWLSGKQVLGVTPK